MSRGGLLILTFFLAVLIAGCSASFSFTPTGTTAPARAEDCNVQLLPARPDQPHRQLGVLDQSGHGDIRNAGEFLRAVRAQVCAAGGNGIIPRLSGTGQYMGGTVVELY